MVAEIILVYLSMIMMNYITHIVSVADKYKTLNGELPEYKQNKIIKDMIEGIVEALPSRKIDSETCKKFNYQTGTHNGKPVHIANYYDKDYNIVAQKLKMQIKNLHG